MDKNNNIIPKMIRKNSSANKTKKREHITIVPAKFNDTFRRVTKKETYCKLVMLADDTGTIIIRLKQLADFLNTSDKSISKNLIELHNSGLIIKGKTFDQYGYQAMMIHLVDYNKLSENNTKSNQDIAGQILNKQFYETRVIHENEKDIHETWNNFTETAKDIHETRFPYNEIQKNDIKNTNVKQKIAREQAVILSNQSSLPPDEPTTSVSDSAVFDCNSQTSISVITQLKAYGFWQNQAESAVDRHGCELVQKSIDYALLKAHGNNIGRYLNAMLKVPAGDLFIPETQGSETNDREVLEANQKLAQAHLVNIRKWFSKNYLTVESYINTLLFDQKYIIFELSKILQGNVLAGKNETVNEPLNGKVITIGELRDCCDQLMGAENIGQEASKTIVSESVEKANEQNKKAAKETTQEIMVRLANSNKISKGVLTKTLDKLHTQKAKSRTETVERNKMVNEAFVEAVGNSTLMSSGSQTKSEAVNDAVPDQLNQGFIQKSEAVKINSDSVNDSVKSQNWCGENLNNLTDKEKQILSHFRPGKKLSRKDIMDLTGLKESSVVRSIRGLSKIGIISTEGHNRFTCYFLTNQN